MCIGITRLRGFSITDVNESLPGAALGQGHIRDIVVFIRDMLRDALHPTRRIRIGPFGKHAMLFGLPPPTHHAHLDSRMIFFGDRIDLLAELAKSHEPWRARFAGTAAVIKRTSSERMKLHASLRQITEPIFMIAQDELAAGGF